jgi:Leucine-rich repeat (LRR) protein
MEMNPELSCAWEHKLHEQEQSGNPIQLLPPSLEKLDVQKLTDGVQSGLLACLPTITELTIRKSPNLTSLQLGCCRALKKLQIRNCGSLALMEGLQFCRNLTSLTVFNSLGVGSFLELVPHQQGGSEIWSSLETLEISDASVLSVPLCKQLTSLRRLELGPQFGEQPENMVSLTEEQERALQLLTSLQELRFSMGPNLLSLPANLNSLTSLKRLYIRDCKSITRLPDMGLPPSLRYLLLFDCTEELGAHCRRAATDKLRVAIDYRFVVNL